MTSFFEPLLSKCQTVRACVFSTQCYIYKKIQYFWEVQYFCSNIKKVIAIFQQYLVKIWWRLYEKMVYNSNNLFLLSLAGVTSTLWGNFVVILGWLAHLVSRFACNTRWYSMRVQIHRFPTSNRCNKNLASIHQVNKQTLHHQSINQMVIW